MKTVEILTISELKAQYAASGYATSPQYYQVWFDEELVGWQGLALWINNQDPKKEVAVFENTKKGLVDKKSQVGHTSNCRP